MLDARKEIERLWKLGFAVHLLAPKSKRPLEMKWTTGERKSLDELMKSYKPGQNIGVRLGFASKIGTKYLSVVDCDVKSEKVTHQSEMIKKLYDIFEGSLDGSPIVSSGRGNGSRHIYVLADTPMKQKRLAQSAEVVKVKMPSAQTPSKKERETLSEKEIKAGYRLRPAWEIALMGEGQQVVLPPSIHPDSGKAYTWQNILRESGQIAPLLSKYLEVEVTKGNQNGSDGKGSLGNGVIGEFTPAVVDLVGSLLGDETVDAIISGTDVSDRSAALLGVANKMLKVGFSDHEILTVLTDPDYYLGGTAYDHAKTRSRARAADWVRRFTLEKSKRETLASEIFKAEVVETKILSESEAKSQLAEIVTPRGEGDWKVEIERSEHGRPKNTLKNVLLILSNALVSLPFKKDEFAITEMYAIDTPWGGKKDSEIKDIDLIRIKIWLLKNWRVEPSDDRIHQAMSAIADLNRFHPVKDYLEALPAWDGVPRIDTWLKRLMRAKAQEPYLSAVSRKTLCAMIARIYKPGCKFEPVLILEGPQGAGKSRSLKALGGEWFTDAVIDIRDKDAVLVMRSRWLIEAGELSGLKRADNLSLKSFISRESDRIRVPYGKRMEDFPRQCVFVGTTNDREYLNDPTGARRFWPVEVGACLVEEISAERDQLFAEAMFTYEMGEPLWLEDEEMNEVAKEEQGSRALVDTWEDKLDEWLAGIENGTEISPKPDREKFRTEDLFKTGGPFAGEDEEFMNVRRVHALLRQRGFENERVWNNDTKIRLRFWQKKR